MKKLCEDDWINYVCSTFSLNLTGSLLSLDLDFKDNYDTPEFLKIKKGQRSFPRELKQVSEEE